MLAEGLGEFGEQEWVISKRLSLPSPDEIVSLTISQDDNLVGFGTKVSVVYFFYELVTRFIEKPVYSFYVHTIVVSPSYVLCTSAPCENLR